ncbi:MAG TPA: histidinol dehydrogenase [Balneolales bacterium]|jgi:histidinol dehydrogenase|nr:histidinol dehydrogenase [Balneolales bacterium]
MDVNVYSNLSEEQRAELCTRPRINSTDIYERVQEILDQVRQRGDEALLEYTEKFDRIGLEKPTENPGTNNANKLSNDVKEAFDTAWANVYRFHQAQIGVELEVETVRGVRCRRVARPIERIGLYVPGGSAILPSSALMLGIPALIAGCREIVIATPPDKSGNIAPEIKYIAERLGVNVILKAGGAQAIAALAYGTESVPKVDKIVGPGNQYVTAAKMLLQNSDAMISIDMPAGPSEVLVIADGQAQTKFVAADLLSQAEHGPDSQVILVAIDGFDIDGVQKELEAQLEDLPRRDTAKSALSKSHAIKVQTEAEAVAFSNQYAPEHLIINTEDPQRILDRVMNAGSVFLGPWSPESAGDYASGTNHTLPTYGYARMYSGVSTDTFRKQITVQELSASGLMALGPTVMKMAEVEQLEAHKRAVELRLQQLKES